MISGYQILLFSLPTPHCRQAQRCSVTRMKSDTEGGLEPRPPLQPLEQCSFCSITLHPKEKLLQGNECGSGKGEMTRGERGGGWNLVGDCGGWGSIWRWEGWGTRVPGWLGPGPALPIPSGLGLQAASASSIKTPGEPEIKYSSSPVQAALLPLTANVLL